MLYVCGLVSTDAQVEVLIVALSQMSIDEEELVSIDAARFSFRILSRANKERASIDAMARVSIDASSDKC
ncbi:hypothetical protein F2Q69_00030349 [Brassica cretica]|uniref:Uncharacterized protein n=1 Tax=Brassica cretica TaxID=69181 RepID=A0A8S9S6P9_BRACR|nr:hypothetical protein F2Q69_00030349 [Brassica cretica]